MNCAGMYREHQNDAMSSLPELKLGGCFSSCFLSPNFLHVTVLQAYDKKLEKAVFLGRSIEQKPAHANLLKTAEKMLTRAIVVDELIAGLIQQALAQAVCVDLVKEYFRSDEERPYPFLNIACCILKKWSGLNGRDKSIIEKTKVDNLLRTWISIARPSLDLYTLIEMVAQFSTEELQNHYFYEEYVFRCKNVNDKLTFAYAVSLNKYTTLEMTMVMAGPVEFRKEHIRTKLLEKYMRDILNHDFSELSELSISSSWDSINEILRLIECSGGSI